jgi:hypothetical protein
LADLLAQLLDMGAFAVHQNDEVVGLCRAVDYAELPVSVLASAVVPGAGSA